MSLARLAARPAAPRLRPASARSRPARRAAAAPARTARTTPARRSSGGLNPGKKSSKFNQDCAICRTCRPTIPDAAVLKGRGNGIKWRVRLAGISNPDQGPVVWGQHQCPGMPLAHLSRLWSDVSAAARPSAVSSSAVANSTLHLRVPHVDVGAERAPKGHGA